MTQQQHNDQHPRSASRAEPAKALTAQRFSIAPMLDW